MGSSPVNTDSDTMLMQDYLKVVMATQQATMAQAQADRKGYACRLARQDADATVRQQESASWIARLEEAVIGMTTKLQPRNTIPTLPWMMSTSVPSGRRMGRHTLDRIRTVSHLAHVTVPDMCSHYAAPSPSSTFSNYGIIHHYKILSKMVLGQIIKDDKMVEFKKRLKPHQLAKLPKILAVEDSEDENEDHDSKMNLQESTTTTEKRKRRRLKKGPENVFDRAVMQHNLLSVSRIYNRISFKGLGNLVGLTSSAVKIMPRTMIQENCLKASINQVKKLLTFMNSIDPSEDNVVA
ncbi:hypothetical protein KEM48_010913 [Puccinia striiformis f. sp. tritici PST-130]|nr:hypothetical protein KEM48_010913 [Puccinia striiformis f. sp. tritici PST-130]